MTTSEQTVAVIGAGIGGLSCARQLREAGFSVRIFDKSRGVGGRVSLRRTESGSFDHGAQYLTATDSKMAHQVMRWKEAEVIAPWECRIGTLNSGKWKAMNSGPTRYVGVPSMTSIAKSLKIDLDIVLQTQVTKVMFNDDGWQLFNEKGEDLGVFDLLILNTPAPQCAALLSDFPSFISKFHNAKFSSCWAVMLAFQRELEVPWDAAFVDDSALAWIARNSSKPGRPDNSDCWVLHANHDWSEIHLEDSPEAVIDQLVASFWQAFGMPPEEQRLAAAHRWRYGLPNKTLEQEYLFDEDLRLGACGDWCGGASIEGALLSGLALAERVTMT